MKRNPPTPLTPNEEEALALLEERFDVNEEALSHEAAVAHLVDGGFVRGTANNLIEQLQLKGYLYEAADGVRLTEGG